MLLGTKHAIFSKLAALKPCLILGHDSGLIVDGDKGPDFCWSGPHFPFEYMWRAQDGHSILFVPVQFEIKALETDKRHVLLGQA